ncbi:MAG: SDR family NAD(P)-dependent oxidoreductase [Chitinophagaceae bacterium]
MNGRYQGITATVTGSNCLLKEEMIFHFLQEGITVMAPVNNALEVDVLNTRAAAAYSGHLVTLLTDLASYEKQRQLSKDFLEEYSRCDLLVYLSQNIRRSPFLSEVSRNEWEAMIEEDITSFCIAADLYLENMHNKGGGMFLHVANRQSFTDRPYSALANIAATVQQEVIARFAEEASRFNIEYQQIITDNITNNDSLLNEEQNSSLPREIAAQVLNIFSTSYKPIPCCKKV